MASRISTKAIVSKCKNFILKDPVSQAVDPLIQDAVVTAIREINTLDDAPMSWCKGSYDGLYTRFSAEVSAATQANPGVFTADSLDDDLTGHGFTDKDLVFCGGFGDDSLDELNNRLFRLNYVDSTTFSLLNMDGQHALDTSSLDAYSSGGVFYHAGLILPATTIEPQTGNEWEKWKIGDIHDVTFDGKPATPISEDAARKDFCMMRPGGRPTRWRYWRNDYQGFGSTEHYLCFHPYPAQKYPIRVEYVKSYPDPALWDDSEYPPCPPEIHDFIWHRALHILATNAEKQRRENEKVLMGRIEVLYAQHWANKVVEDSVKIINLSRTWQGSRVVGSADFSA